MRPGEHQAAAGSLLPCAPVRARTARQTQDRHAEESGTIFYKNAEFHFPLFKITFKIGKETPRGRVGGQAPTQPQGRATAHGSATGTGGMRWAGWGAGTDRTGCWRGPAAASLVVWPQDSPSLVPEPPGGEKCRGPPPSAQPMDLVSREVGNGGGPVPGCFWHEEPKSRGAPGAGGLCPLRHTEVGNFK